jgi:hypothetical protein
VVVQSRWRRQLGTRSGSAGHLDFLLFESASSCHRDMPPTRRLRQFQSSSAKRLRRVGEWSPEPLLPPDLVVGTTEGQLEFFSRLPWERGQTHRPADPHSIRPCPGVRGQGYVAVDLRVGFEVLIDVNEQLLDALSVWMVCTE